MGAGVGAGTTSALKGSLTGTLTLTTARGFGVDRADSRDGGSRTGSGCAGDDADGTDPVYGVSYGKL